MHGLGEEWDEWGQVHFNGRLRAMKRHGWLMADASRAVSGSYQEKLAGLRAQEILVQGTFSLEKVMDGELVGNDE